MTATQQPYRKFQCVLCGEIYDEALGVPEFDIAPGTRWEDVPEDWLCMACGAPKSEYVLLED
ncbi:rubredoxin [Nevskia ramosa]|uniref:rubredoxin n=1 Tax=Nevskia ramosa TaxID=64002 RepID=UPI0023567BFF|nr:rubredoxin [Nevskia ramosa]